jgi:phospholipid/cholesterol/gamma-HCH transport system ATP-binding protein
MISVRNVHKQFGSQVVLNGITIDIEPGKTTAVVGPSGVGKSVLLKLIMGIMSPDRGEILIGGENITAARSEVARNEIRRSLGVLFQSAALFDSLTIYDNIAFSLRERLRMSATKAHKRVSQELPRAGFYRYSQTGWNGPGAYNRAQSAIGR